MRHSRFYVALIERRGTLGEGVAYSTQELEHLLNVPAGRMSAFPDRPDDFVAWATRRYGNVSDADYLPRRWFGEYVRDALHAAAKDGSGVAKLDIVFDEARRVTKRPSGGWILHMGRGSSICADAIILAIGHCPPSDPLSGKWLGPRTRFIGDPWQPFAIDKIRPAERVLILGSGLTAVDAVLSLSRQRRTGGITMVSLRGLLPLSHAPTPVAAADLSRFLHPLLEAPAGVRALELLRTVRNAVREAGKTGGDWRAVVDGVRPYTARLWQAMPLEERRRFFSRIRSFWEVHRHRMALAVGDKFTQMLAEGLLRIIAGRIEVVREDGGGVTAIVREPGSEKTTPLAIDWVVNCTGPRPSNSPESSPVIGYLLAQRQLRLDPLKLWGRDERAREYRLRGRADLSQFVRRRDSAQTGLLGKHRSPRVAQSGSGSCAAHAAIS